MRVIKMVEIEDPEFEGSVLWGMKCSASGAGCENATQLNGCEHVGSSCFDHQISEMEGSVPAPGALGVACYPVITFPCKGLRRGDLLLAINGQPYSPELLWKLGQAKGSGLQVDLLIERAGNRWLVTVGV